jgi:L-arabinose transport system substrate-binding protein
MKKIVQTLVVTMVALSFATPLFAAGQQAAAKADAKIKLGFLVKMPEEPWFQIEWMGADKAGKNLGFDVIKIGVPDGEKVLAAMDNLAAQGAKGFVICTPDTKLGPAIVAKANSLKLKVMSVDDQFVKADGTPMVEVPHLGMSGSKIGEQVGKAIADEMKNRKWNPAETGGIAISFNELATAKERVQGAIAALTAAGFPTKQIWDAPQRTTDVEGGFNAANPVITNHPEIKNWVVFSINDGSVIGGVRALEGRGIKADNIIGVGIAGQSQALDEFKKTSMNGFFGSIFVAAFYHGNETAKLMYNWVSKGEAPVPNTATGGTLITRENYIQVYTDNGVADQLK